MYRLQILRARGAPPSANPGLRSHDTSLVSMAMSVSILTALERDYKFIIAYLGLALLLLQPPGFDVLVGLCSLIIW